MFVFVIVIYQFHLYFFPSEISIRDGVGQKISKNTVFPYFIILS